MIRLIGYFFTVSCAILILVFGFLVWYIAEISKELPDYQVLNNYEPPVTTRFYAADGSLMAEYARQRRLYIPIQAIPEIVKQAYISAEDKNFYKHNGIDFFSLARAIFNNVRYYATNRRLTGASTITQQVSKNFLLSSERTLERKLKEFILSFRIERAYSKKRILELYLNEIYLGLGSYGIASAALTYFDKSVSELNLQEVAYLAALPKAPSNYHPFRKAKSAITRRNWVIDRMVANNYITLKEANLAKKEPLVVNPRQFSIHLSETEYFSEEVRREIVKRYGEEALYEGGLSVRTTLDSYLQKIARKALINGLVKYDQSFGYRGPVANINTGKNWGKNLFKIKWLSDMREWKLAVVLSADKSDAVIGIQPSKLDSGKISDKRETGRIALKDMKWATKINYDGRIRTVKSLTEILKNGDVILVEPVKNQLGVYRLQQKPKISGAFVALDPHTGRILAMVGGFSFADSQFNRATQAFRQPGSLFKPFVYAAALDNGYTPSSIILDTPIEIDQGFPLGIWKPKNYDGKYAGPSILRIGIEQSRNLMTVQLAQDMGMKLIADYARQFGIYDEMLPVLSMSLGAGETTLMQMSAAFSVFANGGKQIKPSLIDRIQNRYGKNVYKHERRNCETCNVDLWMGQEEPVLEDNRKQIIDPRTAYQITSMMEGAVKRGTARAVQKTKKIIAGKTGTTNEEKDAWFIGYSPDLVAGVYVGFDNPYPMGRGNTGGRIAAPIFTEFMKKALEDTPPVEFRVPSGIRFISIDKRTGLRGVAGEKGVIMEAFKSDTSPPDAYSVIGFNENIIDSSSDLTENNSDASLPTLPTQTNPIILNGTGGLY